MSCLGKGRRGGGPGQQATPPPIKNLCFCLWLPWCIPILWFHSRHCAKSSIHHDLGCCFRGVYQFAGLARDIWKKRYTVLLVSGFRVVQHLPPNRPSRLGVCLAPQACGVSTTSPLSGSTAAPLNKCIPPPMLPVSTPKTIKQSFTLLNNYN